MDLKKLWDQLSVKDEANTEEAPANEQPDNITREEFNLLVEALQKMEEAISKMEVDSAVPNEEEDAPQEEPMTPEEEAKLVEEAAVVEAEAEEKINEKIATGINSALAMLKKSTKLPVNGNNSLSGSPKGWVDPFASFRAEQKELEAKTRL